MPKHDMALNEDARKRKSHTKSRKGCGNCKLRRVKCDENRPACGPCNYFGVDCDYNSVSSDLQFSGVGAFQIQITALPIPSSLDTIIQNALGSRMELHTDLGVEGPTSMLVTADHMDTLRRFQSRTVLTIGTSETAHIYQNELTKMAVDHSFLFHVTLRFTLMHDRYIADSSNAKPTEAETFHAYHGAGLFGQRLSESIIERERDSIWAAAALLGACSFASIEAASAEQAWPMKTPEVDDLDWLKMSEGKKEVWRLVDPLRQDSVWRAGVELELNRKLAPSSTRPSDPALDRLFPYVIKLYNLDSPWSNEDGKDPYYTAASILERLLPITPNHSTIMWFLSFLGHMEPEFRLLLEEKDPQAVLLLAWWYAKVITYDAWWLRRRALIECQSICMYLDRVLPIGHEIRRLLEFPRSMCGLQPSRTVFEHVSSSGAPDEVSPQRHTHV